MLRLMILVGLSLTVSGCNMAGDNDKALGDIVASKTPDDSGSQDPAIAGILDDMAARPERFQLEGRAIEGGLMRGIAPAGASQLYLGDSEVAMAENGQFIIAFHRDSAGETLLLAKRDGKEDIRLKLVIAPRAWDIQHVNVALRPSGSSEAFRARRAPELAQIVAARAKRTGAKGWRQNFIWPVKGRISGMFGNQRVYRGEPGSFHSGIDIAASDGTPFVAPADGVVILASNGPFSLEGNLLMIDHGMGLNSAFLHLSKILVADGETVKQGQIIGHIGATGRATGAHLHWGMKWHDARIDPILLTGEMQ